MTYNKEQVKVPRERYRIGTVANYTCENLYSLFGPDSNTCQKSGYWETTLPTCNLEGNKITLAFTHIAIYGFWIFHYSIKNTPIY